MADIMDKDIKREFQTTDDSLVVIDLNAIVCLKQLTAEPDGQIVSVTFANGDTIELIGNDIYNEIADDLCGTSSGHKYGRLLPSERLEIDMKD